MSLRAAISAQGSRGWKVAAPIAVLQRDDSGLAILKARVHEKLLGRIDVATIEITALPKLRAQLKGVIEELLDEESVAFSQAERSQIIIDVQNEVTGLGPLEPLLADASISDVLVNGFSRVYVERSGRLELTSVQFNDNAHLMKIIERIVSQVGRRVDESSPMVDARLADGSRVNAVIPPLALDGPALSIRRFAATPLIDRKSVV